MCSRRQVVAKAARHPASAGDERGGQVGPAPAASRPELARARCDQPGADRMPRNPQGACPKIAALGRAPGERGTIRRASLRYAACAVGLAVALFFALGGSTAAPGTFPGTNGPTGFDGIDQNTHTIQIWRVAANGTGVTQITTTSGAIYNECPSVSANGQLLYVDSFNRASFK